MPQPLNSLTLTHKPYTLHPAPYTLHPTPYTLHPKLSTPHPTPYTLHPTPYTLHPKPYTLHPKLSTPHPTPSQAVTIGLSFAVNKDPEAEGEVFVDHIVPGGPGDLIAAIRVSSPTALLT